MVSSARSQGTFFRVIDILPLTSSPMTTFLLLSAARMRSRFTTSASLKSNEMRRWPLVGAGAAGAAGAGVAWASWTGRGVAATGASWATGAAGIAATFMAGGAAVGITIA